MNAVRGCVYALPIALGMWLVIIAAGWLLVKLLGG
jgi:hypothetical protein